MYLSWVEPPVNIVKTKNTWKSIIFAVAAPPPPLFSTSIHDGGDIITGLAINIQCIKNST